MVSNKVVKLPPRYSCGVWPRDAGQQMYSEALLELHSLETNCDPRRTSDIITSCPRYELYFYDRYCEDVDTNPIATVMLTLGESMHYTGAIAIPAACYIEGRYRKDPELLRKVAEEVTRTARLMGAKHYERHKHVTSNSVLIITKEVPSGRF